MLVNTTQHQEKHGGTQPTMEHPYVIYGVVSKHLELAQINPMTHQIFTRLSSHVFSKAHDRLVLKSMDAEDAEMRQRRRLHMSDDTIREILGESSWSPSRTKKMKMNNSKSRRNGVKHDDDIGYTNKSDGASDYDADDDDMFVNPVKNPIVLGNKDLNGNALGSKRGRVEGIEEDEEDKDDDDDNQGEDDNQRFNTISLPAGLTFSDLLNCVQASSEELKVALTASDRVICLPHEYWNKKNGLKTRHIQEDRYLLVDEQLQAKVVDAILDVIVSRDYDIENIPFMSLLRELRRDSVCSVPMIYHGVRSLQSEIERRKGILRIPKPGHFVPSVDGEEVERVNKQGDLHKHQHDTQQTDAENDGATQIYSIASFMDNTSTANPNLEALETELNRMVIITLDSKAIALFKAVQLFKSNQNDSPCLVKDFMSDWKFNVPPGVSISEDLLSGIALRSKVKAIAKAIAKAKAKDMTKTVNSDVDMDMEEAYEFFPKSALSHIPKDRFTQLFTHRAEWTKEDITPYIDDFVSKSLSLDQLLLKESRAVRSTSLPLQPDGKPVMVYTWR